MLEIKEATIAIGERVLASNLSFIAADRQLTCVTGPAGSGKTTLLRMLMGFLPVTQGFVSVDGELLTVRSAHAFRRMIAYLPQSPERLAHVVSPEVAPVPEPDVYAVWGSAVLPRPVSLPEAAPLAPEAVYELLVQTVSQPGKQIIVADEPAASLPPELTDRLLSLLRQQAAQGKTVLVASRRPEIVGRCDQLITLKPTSSV